MSSTKSSLAALTLGAIGVVYGDIGTSVLYAMKEVFGSGHVPFTPDNIYGILSIFFWTLTTIVSVKYVLLVLRADNNGEGGTLTLMALAQRAFGRSITWIAVLGMIGAALFYGDAIITPAISVLAAAEGLHVIAPSLSEHVLSIAVLLITALFAIERFGTSVVSLLFGPVMLLWFLAPDRRSWFWPATQPNAWLRPSWQPKSIHSGRRCFWLLTSKVLLLSRSTNKSHQRLCSPSRI